MRDLSVIGLHSQTVGSEKTPLLKYISPLLITGNLYILSTSKIDKPVSIIHVCSDMCRMSNIIIFYLIL